MKQYIFIIKQNDDRFLINVKSDSEENAKEAAKNFYPNAKDRLFAGELKANIETITWDEFPEEIEE